MHLNAHEKEIVRKIATGEVKDIPSYLKVFNLTTFYQLNKEDIKRRLENDEDGKMYKELKKDVKLFDIHAKYKTFPNGLQIPNYSITPVEHTEDDYQLVSAKLCYNESTYTVNLDDSISFSYDFFKGINITNNFSDIKTFLTIWQFLKSEGLILEVEKKVTSQDYEAFFEYKPIEHTMFYKTKKKIEQSLETEVPVLPKSDDMSSSQLIDRNAIKDYRNYIDSLFEYNKSHELICTQFINKQIYGISELDLFIKKGFKTNEEINITRTLVPAYLALALTLGIAIWQQLSVDNSDIVIVQNQIEEIQTTMNEEKKCLSSIEKNIKWIIENTSTSDEIEKKLDEIIKEINDNIDN